MTFHIPYSHGGGIRTLLNFNGCKVVLPLSYWDIYCYLGMEIGIKEMPEAIFPVFMELQFLAKTHKPD